MKPSFELWLCSDCMVIRETDVIEDLSERREAEIRACLHALEEDGSVLANDSGDWGDQMKCRECGHIQSTADFPSSEIDTEDGPMTQRFCPKCHSDDVEIREGGEDEFSWSRCDCCGSTLGGSRHRYALFPKD